jgi:hypothetical protein
MARIFFDYIKVDSLSDSSGIFSGENRQKGWRHVRETKQGFGSVSGDNNTVSDSVHVLTKRQSGRERDR